MTEAVVFIAILCASVVGYIALGFGVFLAMENANTRKCERGLDG